MCNDGSIPFEPPIVEAKVVLIWHVLGWSYFWNKIPRFFSFGQSVCGLISQMVLRKDYTVCDPVLNSQAVCFSRTVLELVWPLDSPYPQNCYQTCPQWTATHPALPRQLRTQSKGTKQQLLSRNSCCLKIPVSQ